MRTPIRTHPELRNLLKWAGQLGFICDYTKGGHIRFTRPNTPVVTTSATPGDYRSFMNARAKLKRALRDSELTTGK